MSVSNKKYPSCQWSDWNISNMNWTDFTHKCVRLMDFYIREKIMPEQASLADSLQREANEMVETGHMDGDHILWLAERHKTASREITEIRMCIEAIKTLYDPTGEETQPISVHEARIAFTWFIMVCHELNESVDYAPQILLHLAKCSEGEVKFL